MYLCQEKMQHLGIFKENILIRSDKHTCIHVTDSVDRLPYFAISQNLDSGHNLKPKKSTDDNKGI